MKTMFELSPMADNRKSYYGKAKIIQDGNRAALLSYNTIVCEIIFPGNVPTFDGNGITFRRLWNGYSATTQRHINSFRNCYGLAGIGKQEWLALPINGSNSMTWQDSLRTMYARRNNK